jgi:membrane protease YdiL (CAAX protease family)
LTPQSWSASQPLILAEPERPFWGFSELFLVGALFLPAVFAGEVAVRGVTAYFHGDAAAGSALLAAEFIAYAIVFIVLRFLFARHGEPLFRSLGWVDFPFRPVHLMITGFVLALTVVVLGSLLRLPDVETPFDKLLSDPFSRIAIGLFGVTLGPIIEELLFRGFLQPVLVSTIGVLPGILSTSVLFGVMHLAQNAGIWQSGLLITLVGFVLGVIRHVSGSTRASSIVHMSYNALPFFVLIFSGDPNSHK